MRRLLLLGLLLATPLAAQSPPCKQLSISRTASATPGYVHVSWAGDCVLPRDTTRVADTAAIALLNRALRDTSAVLVSTRAALKVATDSLAKWPKPAPPVVTPPVVTPPVVTPPKDSTPSTPGKYPNRPANYSKVLGELDLSQTVPPLPAKSNGNGDERGFGADPWTIISDGNGRGGSAWSRVSDSTAPQSAPWVWKVFMPAGSYGGGVEGTGSSTGFGRFGRPINTAELYASYWVKYSPGFRFHSVSEKFARFDYPNSLGQAFLLQLKHNGDYLRASDEGLGRAYEPQNGNAIATGVWHQVELVLVRGAAGTVKVWVDGVLRTNYTGVPVMTGGNVTATDLDTTLGGGGVVLPADQWFEVDHVFLAAP